MDKTSVEAHKITYEWYSNVVSKLLGDNSLLLTVDQLDFIRL